MNVDAATADKRRWGRMNVEGRDEAMIVDNIIGYK